MSSKKLQTIMDVGKNVAEEIRISDANLTENLETLNPNKEVKHEKIESICINSSIKNASTTIKSMSVEEVFPSALKIDNLGPQRIKIRIKSKKRTIYFFFYKS